MPGTSDIRPFEGSRESGVGSWEWVGSIEVEAEAEV